MVGWWEYSVGIFNYLSSFDTRQALIGYQGATRTTQIGEIYFLPYLYVGQVLLSDVLKGVETS